MIKKCISILLAILLILPNICKASSVTDEETLNKYSFIKVLLDNELDEDEKLKSDYSILMEYKQAELNCENVFKVKEVISKIK